LLHIRNKYPVLFEGRKEKVTSTGQPGPSGRVRSY
jgi:hypothetical protein